MSIAEELRGIAAEFGLESKETKGVTVLSGVLAEKKGFLSRKKVTYEAHFRIDQEQRTVFFSELLKESGSGAGGVGTESWSTKSGKDGLSGQIDKRIAGLGSKYQIRFQAGEIRDRIARAAQADGYQFEYKITPRGVRKG